MTARIEIKQGGQWHDDLAIINDEIAEISRGGYLPTNKYAIRWWITNNNEPEETNETSR